MPTIMVVGADPTMRKLLRSALEAESYRVCEAEDAKTASAHMAVEPPDLVVQDRLLTEREHSELASALARLRDGRGVPVLSLAPVTATATANGAATHARQAAAAATSLSAQIAPAELLQSVHAQLLAATSDQCENVGEGRRVLVVDDDPVQRKRLHLSLASMGFEIATADDGLDALEQAREQPPDAIVSDVLMPKLDGFELCLQVRRDPRLSQVPLVLVSSNYLDESDQELATRLGANRYVLRSLHFEQVIEALLGSLDQDPPPVPAESVRRFGREHGERVARQLERQTLLNAGLSRETALHKTQLSLWRGMCEALAAGGDFGAALTQVFTSALRSGDVVKGALYLLGPGTEVRLEHAHGYAERDHERVAAFFGQNQLLKDVIASGMPLAIPSPMFDGPIASEFLSRAGASSALIVPIVAGQTKIGGLLLGSHVPDVGSEAPLQFAQALGLQIGKALEAARAVSSIAESERRYRGMMQGTSTGVWTVDADSRTTYANPRLAEMLGYKPEDMLGRPLHDFVRGHVPDERGAQTAATDGGSMLAEAPAASAPFEVQLKRKDGQLVPALISTSALASGAGGGELALVADLSQQKHSQAEAMMADRLRSIGTLAAAVAYDTRAPLGTTLASIDSALAQIDSLPILSGHHYRLEQMRDLLRDARKAGERVRRALRDFERFGGSEAERRGPVDVEALLEASARMAWNEVRSRARLVQEYARVPPVQGSEVALAQVFFNLIVNAAEAIDPGHADLHEIRLSTTLDSARRVIVEVQDTGRGMSAETVRQLLSPSFGTAPAGSGLGLCICHRIVTRLGGQLLVESEPGRGTTARVLLPACSGGG
jgi:PAS domain S-box-containing protein